LSVVLVESQRHILVVTLNRPGAMNAVNAHLNAGAGDALERAGADPAIRAVVLTDPPSADRAAAPGLVNHVVPADELPSAAIKLAERITHNPPPAVRESKRVALAITDGGVPGQDVSWYRNGREIRALRNTCMREGTRAFAEKRRPQWRAR
jgi:crotonobetainyl-CoA hydratase